jgi:hypothetical protein
MIKLRRTRWTGDVVRMGEMGNDPEFEPKKPEGKRSFVRLDVDGGIILNGVQRNWVWTGFIWLRIGSSGGLLGTR